MFFQLLSIMNNLKNLDSNCSIHVRYFQPQPQSLTATKFPMCGLQQRLQVAVAVAVNQKFSDILRAIFNIYNTELRFNLWGVLGVLLDMFILGGKFAIIQIFFYI